MVSHSRFINIHKTKIWVKGHIQVLYWTIAPHPKTPQENKHDDNCTSLYPIPFESTIYRSGPPGKGSFIGLMCSTPTHPWDNKHDGLLMAFVLPPPSLSNPFECTIYRSGPPWKRVLYWTIVGHPNTPPGQQT